MTRVCPPSTASGASWGSTIVYPGSAPPPGGGPADAAGARPSSVASTAPSTTAARRDARIRASGTTVSRTSLSTAGSATATGPSGPIGLLLLGRDQRHRDRVDAVAQVGGGVVALAGENVPEVAVAVGAEHLDPAHEQAVVGPLDDPVRGQRGEERRPAAVRLELGLAAEELRAAGPAGVHADGLGVGVLAHERRLGAGLAQHLVLGRGEFRTPLGVGLDDLGGGLGDAIHGSRVGACGAPRPDPFPGRHNQVCSTKTRASQATYAA